MNPGVYHFDIERATRVVDLAALREDIKADETLDSVNKDELLRLVSARIHGIQAANKRDVTPSP
jgi:hypothetical protein